MRERERERERGREGVRPGGETADFLYAEKNGCVCVLTQIPGFAVEP